MGSTSEALLQVGAVHPTITTQFKNFLATHPALEGISAMARDALREVKKQDMYIEDKKVAHHPHIGKHSLATGALTITLASIAGIEPESVKELASLGALHDSYKIADMLLQRIGELRAEPEAFRLPKGEELSTILKEAGVSSTDIQQMLAGGHWVAHPSIVHFLKKSTNNGVELNTKLADVICLHLADDMMRETTPLPVRYRMLATGFSEPLDKLPSAHKYPDLWNRGMYMAGDGTFSDRALSADNSELTLVGRFIDLQLACANAMSLFIIQSGLEKGTITENEVESAKQRVSEVRPPLASGNVTEPQPDEILCVLVRDRAGHLFAE